MNMIGSFAGTTIVYSCPLKALLFTGKTRQWFALRGENIIYGLFIFCHSFISILEIGCEVTLLRSVSLSEVSSGASGCSSPSIESSGGLIGPD
jgi:hypothetical protein